ncbi:GntR family transcriptional regulator [Flavobacteriaceae bacterium 14752]|uniref:GntR family transcriptional regulator n=1 Tax=Mesohalobacter salilacus TaxID=2491711 RepID=UPI000F6343A1|nr:GntR family transcriptional regulator [Flavobacteriaceae bacterium 14752]
MNLVKINKNISVPKYKQIVNSLEHAILKGHLKKGNQLPSLNVIKKKHNVSRDTVLMAFNELKTRGIIHSVVGKGYYISSEDVAISQKILLLFDELNAFKEDLYNAFLDNLDDNIKVDIYFHHFNPKVFHQIISENVGNYTFYVIMPANLKDINDDISLIQKDKVFILDQLHKQLNTYPAVYQNFEKDVFNGLSKIKDKLLNYNNFKLIFSSKKQPKGILNGFINFNKSQNISYQISEELSKEDPEKGTAYLVLEDTHLIQFIKGMKEKNFKLINDVGLISYNESLLKEVIIDGITTISTDFKSMGEQLANMVMNQSQEQIENESRINIRKSV